MEIIKADMSYFEAVNRITHDTINAVYPHYYPDGAVRFFLDYHNKDSIIKDIEAGKVFILLDDGVPAGTVTINNNDIGRFFVLPEYQGRGFGSKLLHFAEKLVFSEYNEAVLSSSFPAKQIYLNKGYVTTDYHILDAFGDHLCFDNMKKKKEDFEREA